MNPIKLSLDRFTLKPTKKFRSERDELVTKFTEKINEGRDGVKFKKLTEKSIAIKLSHLKGFELSHFYCECLKKENFSKYFWWAIKIK